MFILPSGASSTAAGPPAACAAYIRLVHPAATASGTIHLLQHRGTSSRKQAQLLNAVVSSATKDGNQILVLIYVGQRRTDGGSRLAGQVFCKRPYTLRRNRHISFEASRRRRHRTRRDCINTLVVDDDVLIREASRGRATVR